MGSQPKGAAGAPRKDGTQQIILHVDPPRRARLRKLGRLHFEGDLNIANIAQWVLDLALAHLDQTSAQLQAFCHYRDLEGFEAKDSSKIVQSQLNRAIKPCVRKV